MPDKITRSSTDKNMDIDETKLPGNALNEFPYMGGGVDVTFMSGYNYNILL